MAALLVSGCVVGPEYQAAESTAITEDFANRDSALLTASAPDIAWWQELAAPELNDLIQRAAIHNHDIRIARANVLAARAIVSQGRLGAFPVITAGGAVTRQKTSSGSGSTFDARTTLYEAGFDASWELDLFGGVRRSIEAFEADFAALQAQERATFVSVAAEVARSYVELRGAQYRLDVAQKNADSQQQTYELTRILRDGGRGTELDVVQAQAQLESTRATIPPLYIEMKRSLHRLSVLVGEPPAALSTQFAEPEPLPTLPDEVHVGDPAELLRRRPDVAAAERQLAADTARIGIAVADLFPRITLFGSAGYLTINSGDFGEAQSERWRIGPQLSWPAFDLGRVRARIAGAEANADASLAGYEQTVLRALEETENAMVRYVQGRKREARLNIASQASTRASEIARLRFRDGVETFLTVLDAERRQLEAQDALAAARAESTLALISVYKALGGGWQHAFGQSAASKSKGAGPK